MPIITDSGFHEAEALDLLTLDRLGEATGASVLLPNDADAAAVLPVFNRIACIVIPFPKSADGRGFSLARRLRDLGFAGRLRAQGHLIPDQYAFARQCGFDEVEIDADLARRTPEAQWRAAVHTAVPPFRRRQIA